MKIILNSLYIERTKKNGNFEQKSSCFSRDFGCQFRTHFEVVALNLIGVKEAEKECLRFDVLWKIITAKIFLVTMYNTLETRVQRVNKQESY